MFPIRCPDWKAVCLRKGAARHRIALPVVDLNILAPQRSYRQRQPLAIGREARSEIGAWRGYQGLRLPGDVQPRDRPALSGGFAAQVNQRPIPRNVVLPSARGRISRHIFQQGHRHTANFETLQVKPHRKQRASIDVYQVAGPV